MAVDEYDAMSGLVQTGDFYSGAGSQFFPDPFSNMASLAMPQTIESALRMCQFILTSNGTYCAALERVIRYFLTDLEIDGEDLDKKEKEDIKSYLQDDLDIMATLEAVGFDRECYGNSFDSVLERFRRYFSCGRCHFEMAFDQMEAMRASGRAEWIDYEMQATCPKCSAKTAWSMHDRRGGTDQDYVLKRWNPLDVSLAWDPYTDRCSYFWKIPQEERKGVLEGKPDILREAPREVIEACKGNVNIRFTRDVLYHGKERTLAGHWNRGWGLSRVLTNFRQAWYVEVLHRFNEAIALDYVVPFRLITPKGGGSGEPSDPLLNFDMGHYQGQIESLFREHRRDPAGWNYLPFSVEYQALGGEAAELAPYQLMDQGRADLLDAMNVPVQFYKMDLSAQTAGPMMRLFESVHRAVPRTMNRYLSHVMKRLCQLKGWPRCTARLIPPTLVDDINKQMPRVQLMASGQVSPQTGLASLGLNAFDEAKKTLEYQEFQSETQRDMQDRMTDDDLQRQMAVSPIQQLAQQQQSATQTAQPSQAGQPSPSQAPPGASGQFATGPASIAPGDIPQDPQAILAQAEGIAAQLLSQPEAAKDKMLAQIKSQNELLHLAVKAALEKGRERARMAAGDAAMGKVGVFALSRRLLVPSSVSRFK